MEDIKESIIQQCIDVIKRKDVRHELQLLVRPMLDMILRELYPYVFLSLVFVIVSFLLVIGIFIILVRSEKYVYH
jgi:hypothetical protein